MKGFLDKEFEGVPEEFRGIALAQLQEAIREINGRMSMGSSDAIHDLALHRMCGKIFGVLDFLRRFRRALQDVGSDNVAPAT